jgi:uncharacterized integral membrane protein
MTEERTTQRRIPARVWVGLVIALMVLAFIGANRADTEISFVFARAIAPLWLALALAAVGGFLAGFLFARRRR